MQRFTWILLSLVLAGGLPQSQAQDIFDNGELWEHNRSVVSVETTAAQVRILYHTPREELANRGVGRGTLLFEGMWADGILRGQAYRFSSGCPAVAYNVAGRPSTTARAIRLSGVAPRRNRDCRIEGSFEDTLDFRLLFVPQRRSLIYTFWISNIRRAILDAPLAVIVPVSNTIQVDVDSSAQHYARFPYVDLASCVIADKFFENISEQTDVEFIDWFFSVAQHMARTRNLLRALGYPQEIWMDPINRIGIEMVRVLDMRRRGIAYTQGFWYATMRTAEVRAIEDELVTSLRRYRAEHPQSVSFVDIDILSRDLCGGDSFGRVTLRIEPDDARVWIMPAFYYDWCRRTRHTDSGCDFWFRVRSGSVVPFGRYRYRAEWPGRAGLPLEENVLEVEGGADRQNATHTISQRSP